MPFGLRGWSTEIRPGEVLIMPSKLWHWYKSEGPEASNPFRPQLKPIDAYNTAILDSVEFE